MKLIIDIPQTMIDELRDGCFGVKHNIYELAGLIMNGTILEQEPKTDILDKIRADIAGLDDADYDYEGYYKAVTDALQIIDKYRQEG